MQRPDRQIIRQLDGGSGMLQQVLLFEGEGSQVPLSADARARDAPDTVVRRVVREAIAGAACRLAVAMELAVEEAEETGGIDVAIVDEEVLRADPGDGPAELEI